MLQAHPTKKGTGIEIYGSRNDLEKLYETVHKISDTIGEFSQHQKGQYQILMNFAYDIRKGFERNCLVDDISEENEIESRSYGFKLVWTDILIFISILRYNAAYLTVDKLDQANMYMLEYVTEKALFEYDAEGANKIQNFIGQRIDITIPLSFMIFQELQIRYATSLPGKKRFRNIPHLLTAYFSEWSPEYIKFISSLEISAKENNCDMTDLEFKNYPEIIW